jgi:hypothetical protein
MGVETPTSRAFVGVSKLPVIEGSIDWQYFDTRDDALTYADTQLKPLRAVWSGVLGEYITAAGNPKTSWVTTWWNAAAAEENGWDYPPGGGPEGYPDSAPTKLTPFTPVR